MMTEDKNPKPEWCADNWKNTSHERRMIFKIPVDGVPEEEIDEYIREITKKLKAVRDPELSSNTDDKNFWLPANSGTTSDFNAYFYQIEPKSYFWTDLNQLLLYLNGIRNSGNQWYENAWKAEVDFLLTGLENTIKRGYRFKKIGVDTGEDVPYYFNDIDGIVANIKNTADSYDNKNEFLKDLIRTIEYTLKLGYNLTNGLKMERKEVYKRIDGERDYQDKTWVARRTKDGTPDEEKSVAEWIIYIENHLLKAKHAVYYLDTNRALAEVRKVAALAVRAMEIHGAPERVVLEEPKSSCGVDGCGGNCKK